MRRERYRAAREGRIEVSSLRARRILQRPHRMNWDRSPPMSAEYGWVSPGAISLIGSRCRRRRPQSPASAPWPESPISPMPQPRRARRRAGKQARVGIWWQQQSRAHRRAAASSNDRGGSKMTTTYASRGKSKKIPRRTRIRSVRAIPWRGSSLAWPDPQNGGHPPRRSSRTRIGCAAARSVAEMHVPVPDRGAMRHILQELPGATCNGVPNDTNVR